MAAVPRLLLPARGGGDPAVPHRAPRGGGAALTAPWFGELYLASTADLLTPGLSALEARTLAELLGLVPGERVLDAGCGQGRHLSAMQGRGLAMVGVDRQAEHLRLATPRRGALGVESAGPQGASAPPSPPLAPAQPLAAAPALASTATIPLVQADLRALPFGPAFDAAWSWYSSLFLFDEQENRQALRELQRVLRPGGRLLVQHANPLALAREPEARARRALPGGGEVEEVARFDAARGLETLERRLTRGGRVLAGSCTLRYYRENEWRELARDCGFGPPRLASTGPEGAPAPFGEEAIDLIAVLEKPT